MVNRLKTVTYEFGTADAVQLTYTYDLVGNRLTEQDVLLQTSTLQKDLSYSYDAINRLDSIDDLLGTDDVAYTYDSNGNTLTKAKGGVTTTFLYDIRNQLGEVQEGVNVLGRYGYDSDGLRILKIGDAGRRQYTYDQLSVITEADEANLTVSKYDYGLDQLVRLDNSSEGRSFFHLDILGSTANLTDGSAATRQSILYDAWGNERDRVGISANKFTFTGHERDSETGLIYAKARFYDAETGRFLGQDPLLGNVASAPSLNRYAYGFSNPLMFYDPAGMQAESVMNLDDLANEHVEEIDGQLFAVRSLVIQPRLSAEPSAPENPVRRFLQDAAETVLPERITERLYRLFGIREDDSRPKVVFWLSALQHTETVTVTGQVMEGNRAVTELMADITERVPNPLSVFEKPDSDKSRMRLIAEFAADDIAFQMTRPVLEVELGVLTDDPVRIAKGSAELAGGAALGVVASRATPALVEAYPVLGRPVGSIADDALASLEGWALGPSTSQGGVRIATGGSGSSGSGASNSLVGRIRDSGGTLQISRGQVSARDVAAMTRATGNEFAIFRDRASGRLFIRELGRISGEIPPNSRLIIHSHPGEGILAVQPSGADRGALLTFGQRSSVIIDESGSVTMRFARTNELDNPIWIRPNE